MQPPLHHLEENTIKKPKQRTKPPTDERRCGPGRTDGVVARGEGGGEGVEPKMGLQLPYNRLLSLGGVMYRFLHAFVFIMLHTYNEFCTYVIL
jgi:hypothetical protein